MAGNDQFAMYVVRPSSQWHLTPQKGITRKQLASLTTYMRETLHSAMYDAVVETGRTSKLRSRRGSIFNQIMSGRRSRGSGLPSTVSETFMFRPWIAIHETGGTIRPRNTKYLTLPMPAALRVDGRLKRRSAAGWKEYGTFVFTAKSGNKFLVYKNKNTNQLVFLYYLAEEVQIKKNLSLRRAIIRQEGAVVAAWHEGVMDIFNSIDLYGIAFEGMRVE